MESQENKGTKVIKYCPFDKFKCIAERCRAWNGEFCGLTQFPELGKYDIWVNKILSSPETETKGDAKEENSICVFCGTKENVCVMDLTNASIQKYNEQKILCTSICDSCIVRIMKKLPEIKRIL